MEKTQINPWSWQDARGFSQAWKVRDPATTIYVAGQVAVDADGKPVGEGDFAAQAQQVFENLRDVLSASGASLDNIVKLTVFFTDIANLREYSQVKARFITGAQPASSAVQVPALAAPAFMLEVEAIAVV